MTRMFHLTRTFFLTLLSMCLTCCASYFHYNLPVTTIPERCIIFARNTQPNTISQTNEIDDIRATWQRYLQRVSPEASLPDNNYEIISAWLDVADIHFLEKEIDRTAFVIIGTQLGWRYDKTPLFTTIFNDYNSQQGTFLDAVKAITPLAWEQGIEQWPYKEQYPAYKNKYPHLANSSWDICTDRCDIATAISQQSAQSSNTHMDITNMDGHMWVTLFSTHQNCQQEEVSTVRINGTSFPAHIYCPRPDAIAVDFPDLALLSDIAHLIESNKPLTISGIHDISPITIDNKNGSEIIKSLGIEKQPYFNLND